MTKKEITNITEMLTNMVNEYLINKDEIIKSNITSMKQFFTALDLETEYNKVINNVVIKGSNLSFYNKQFIFDTIEIIESYKKEIKFNCLNSSMPHFLTMLAETVWTIDKMDIEDIKKIENRLDKIEG